MQALVESALKHYRAVTGDSLKEAVLDGEKVVERR
jgi:hypothetical protein